MIQAPNQLTLNYGDDPSGPGSLCWKPFLAPETGFVEDNLSKDWGGREWFQVDSSTLHILCTLFLLLINATLYHQALNPGGRGSLL